MIEAEGVRGHLGARLRIEPRALVAIAAALAVFASAVTLGARMPGLDFLDPLRGDATLDYGAWPFGRFAPLRPSYVGQVLGTDITGDSPSPSKSKTAPSISASRAPAPQRVLVEHALTNDDFASALEAPSVPFTARTGAQGASRQAGEPSSCDAAGGGTVWYRYTPGTDVGLVADTFGTSQPTALAVFSGTRLDALERVGCSSSARGNAQVPFAARAGTNYLFQVGTPVAVGQIVFNLELQGRTGLVSLTTSGEQANRGGGRPYLNGDGRFVAFWSEATNLGGQPGPWPAGEPVCSVATTAQVGKGGSWPCWVQVYVRDRATGTTEFVPIELKNRADVPWPDGAWTFSVSNDGRFFPFSTPSRVYGDENTHMDFFLRDRVTGTTERVSVGPAGEDTDGGSLFTDMSDDGRYFAFQSDATNLVPGDTNGVTDAFVWDRLTRTTRRVSVSSSGEQQNDARSRPSASLLQGARGVSGGIALSHNGRFVMFRSAATNLVPDDNNEHIDAFLHDIATGTTTRVSVSSTGEEANDDCGPILDNWGNAISDDGSYVTFGSAASNLVPGDTNQASDLFVRDVVAGSTERVTVSSSGEQESVDAYENWLYFGPFAVFAVAAGAVQATHGFAMSRDGRFVVFSSVARNLVSGDTNDARDVFLRDRVHATTTRVSVSGAGEQGNGQSGYPMIAADGRTVFFASEATNLIPGDRNGFPDVFFHEIPY